MTPPTTAFGGDGQPPPLIQAAHQVYALLALEQSFGSIPAHAQIKVLAIDGTQLAVAVAALGDEFLFGPAAPVPEGPPPFPAHRLTRAALALWRVIEHAVTAVLPRHDDRPVFPVEVWFETDAHTRDTTGFPPGVYSIETVEDR
ncbi:hypothetical protein [Actinokineospora iranica]|uniref:Uncharacterized protein n=1 Tax=Actinokineospora iranica TaxID=1271860 RepID=A0A1G6K2L2_9PSEU|nr:hypothetical protein [Actinokineospora iranica]SDC25269.1 hypothetical protein SAMN05216174_101685 [Actinokineospora iranica]